MDSLSFYLYQIPILDSGELNIEGEAFGMTSSSLHVSGGRGLVLVQMTVKQV